MGWQASRWDRMSLLQQPLLVRGFRCSALSLSLQLHHPALRGSEGRGQRGQLLGGMGRARHELTPEVRDRRHVRLLTCRRLPALLRLAPLALG